MHRISRALARLSIPKLIVTSKGDWLVDPSHGRAMAKAAAPPDGRGTSMSFVLALDQGTTSSRARSATHIEAVNSSSSLMRSRIG